MSIEIVLCQSVYLWKDLAMENMANSAFMHVNVFLSRVIRSSWLQVHNTQYSGGGRTTEQNVMAVLCMPHARDLKCRKEKLKLARH